MIRLMADWEQLFAAVEEHGDELPVLNPYKNALREGLDQIRVAKTHQEALSASRKQATRDVGQRIRESRDLVSRLRSLVKATLGSRDERLTLFGIKPVPLHRAPRPKGGAKGTGSPEGYDVQ